MVAKTETLIDDFNDNSIDTNKWNNWGGANIVETNQDLEITTNAGANWYGIESVNKYDLTGSYVHVRLITPGDTAILYHMTMMYVQLDTSNQIKFSTEANTLIAERNIGGVNARIATTTYDPVVHKWLRIRESAGTIYWDYSTNGQSWTNFTSQANPFAITSLNIDLSSGNWQATSSGTLVKYDDFNTGLPKAETLKDNFNDNSIDTNKWNNWGGAQVVETNQELELTTTTAASYFGMDSIITYDLTSSYFFTKLVYPGNMSITSYVCIFQCYDLNSSNYIEIRTEGNTLRAVKNVLGVWSQLTSIAYSSINHRWIRLRESSGTTYWDYSPDRITWTNLWSEANPITLTAVRVQFMVGNNSIEVSTTTAKFDDLNTGLPKTETLRDDFNDNSIDTNKWVNNGGGHIVETNQELEITTTTSHPTYYYIDSVNIYDLTGSYSLLKLVETNTSLVNVATDIAVYADFNNGLLYSVDNDTLYANKLVATVTTTVNSAAYSTTNHKWLRIRESAGTIYWDTSADGIIWTNFTSLANPITVDSVFIEFAAGTYGATTGTTIAKIDNYNIILMPVGWFKM